MGLKMVDTGRYKDYRVREVSCMTALSPSRLESDLSLNPYRGCTHGCIYCYAPCVINEDRPWGSFVDVRRSIPKILASELKKGKEGVVRVSSVTDPYQEVERDYCLTRMCLEQLKKAGVHVIIQTKSDLVVRDIDLLSEMEVDVGMTVTSVDEDFSKTYEPGAPSPSARLKALKELGDNDIKTWAFIGPLIPGENDDEDTLKEIADRIKETGVSCIYIDKLNIRDGIMRQFREKLDRERLDRIKDSLYDEDHYEERKSIYRRYGDLVW